ncbi:MAG TPA: DNA alkylation repair protein [Cytophagales bacterium]|nr:DNA alkylation repair protein [Cytophagales bacterium]
MADPLKEMFNGPFYERLSLELNKVYPGFSTEAFLSDALMELEGRALNQRMRHTATLLRQYLPSNYEQTLSILYQVIQRLPKGYTTLVFPDFVSLYGLEHFEASMAALKYFTSFGSSEFAVRVFLKSDFDRTLHVMKTWAEDDDVHVRRLASEGSRPRLPWSFKLDRVIQDPYITRPILETLKSDKELYVRKSVANHLNDISKDHPDYVLKLLKEWHGDTKETQWIIKHGARTLLKQGHQEVLQLFGVAHSEYLTLHKFELANASVCLGQELEFSYDVTNHSMDPVPVRMEFEMHFLKKGGYPTKKVFKIGERVVAPQETLTIRKKYSFKPITTRKYYLGQHAISILINGKALEAKPFQLVDRI